MDIGMAVQKMRDIAAKCGTTNLNLSTVEDDIDEEVRGLDAVWKGESKEAFLERYGKAQVKMFESKNAIDKIRQMLEKAIEDLLKADEKGASYSQ